MPKLTETARQARIIAYRSGVVQKLSARIIDVSKPEFTDLFADGNPAKKISSLNGTIILERDLYPDGRLRGVISVDIDDLASMLPELKADILDKTGWKKHLDKFVAEGKDILVGVVDPVVSEYDTSAVDDLLALSLDPISQADVKAKLKAIQDKVKAGNIQ